MIKGTDGIVFVGGDFLSPLPGKFGSGSVLPDATTSDNCDLASSYGPEIAVEIAGYILDGAPIRVECGSMLVSSSTLITSHFPWEFHADRRRIRMMDSRGGEVIVQNIESLGPKAVSMRTNVEQYSTLLSQLQNTHHVQILSTTNSSTKSIIFDVPNITNFETRSPSSSSSTSTQDIVVFSISVDTLFDSSVESIVVQCGALLDNDHTPKTIVINVGGTTANWTSLSSLLAVSHQKLSGSWLTSNIGISRTIWNFYEARNINLQNQSFYGAILAPFADVATNATIYGAIAVQSLSSTSTVAFPLWDHKAACKDFKK
jgi:choice-of-anchor A domain-containing protein